MSSSRPYESKVLTFFLRQLQQGLERHRRAMRQAQNTAAWGLQVALSPIRAIQRAAQMAERQLGAAKPRQVPLLSWLHRGARDRASALATAQADYPVSETLDPPIAQLLEAIQHWLLPHQQTQLPSTPTHSNLAVRSSSLSVPASALANHKSTVTLQGIASNLDTQSLILIGAGNIGLDILTQSQQAFLQEQILALVDAYWQYRHRVPSLGEQIAGHLPLPASWKRALLGQQPILKQWQTQVQQILRGPTGSQASLSVARPEVLSPSPVRGLSMPGLPSISPNWQTKFLEALNLRNWFARPPWLSGLVDSRNTITAQKPNPLPEKLAFKQSKFQHVIGTTAPLSCPRATTVVRTNIQTPNIQTSANQQPASETALPANATVIGYVENPLEQLLRWIDQGLTWLENLGARLRHWYQSKVAPVVKTRK